MTPNDQAQVPESTKGSPLIESDSLVEEVSIDGMCGVY
jgi:mycofactocin precursor